MFGWYGSGIDVNVGNGSRADARHLALRQLHLFVGDDPTGFGMLVSGLNATLRSTVELCGDMGFGHSKSRT